MIVYILNSNIGGGQAVFHSIKELLGHLECDMQEMEFSDEFYVTKTKMTPEEYSKLPEFEGY